ncbi:MAG: hypothetical protein AAF492_10525 [Verrucomicrobiota bacterium]
MDKETSPDDEPAKEETAEKGEETTKKEPEPEVFEPIEFKLSGRKFVRNIVLFFVFLEFVGFLLDYFINYRKIIDIDPIRSLCNITREDCIQTWIGVTQTFLVGLTLWFIVILRKKQGASLWRLFGWSFLALFFTYMAFDDGTFFHERMGTAFDDIFDKPVPQGQEANIGNKMVDIFPSYYWQILYIPPLALTALFMIYFIWFEIRSFKSLFVVCVALGLFVAAVGLDFIEGLHRNHEWNIWGMLRSPELDLKTFELFGRSSFETMVHFGKSVEETIEMLANTLLWGVFLTYLVDKGGRQFSVEFTREAPMPEVAKEDG